MGYHAGLDQLVAEIDKTNLLVKAGKLDQAKIEGKKLIDIRNSNHKNSNNCNFTCKKRPYRSLFMLNAT